jgi:hypothetical protein
MDLPELTMLETMSGNSGLPVGQFSVGGNNRLSEVALEFFQTFQCAEIPNFKPVAFKTAVSVFMVGLPLVDRVRYSVSRDRDAFSATVAIPPLASTTFRIAVR